MKDSLMFKLTILALLAVISIVPSCGKADSNSTSANNTLASDTSSGVTPAIAITSVNFKEPAPVRDHLNDEWVEITNKGTATQDMNGWTLSDASNHTYIFQDFILTPKASAKIHTGEGDNGATDLYWGRTSSVWNNGGDTATLKDGSGTEIARHKEGKLKTKAKKASKA